VKRHCFELKLRRFTVDVFWFARKSAPSLDGSASRQEVDDEDDERHDEQKMNQPAADVRD
jgi:hypothetical protein